MSTSTATAIAMICNGRASTNVGYRQVVISPRGEPRPVHRVVASGCQVADMATYQKPREGDLLVRCEWWPECHTISKLVNAEWLPLGDRGFTDYARLLSLMSDQLHEFLKPIEKREASFLPTGCGWDGVSTTASIRKESNIRELYRGLDATVVNEIVALAANSTYKALPDNWRSAHPMPVKLEYGECVDVPWSYVLWYRDGRVESITPDHNGITPLRDITRVIRLKRGYHTRGDKPFGIAWDMYSR